MARIVIIGQGAREHALAYKLSSQSFAGIQKGHEVLLMGGNPGIAREFECFDITQNSLPDIALRTKKLEPDLVVIGPENYLAQGLTDMLEAQGICVFGPNQKASQLESSKIFMKDICAKAQVAHAAHAQFHDLASAKAFVEQHPHERLVIKVDSLCAGKGVFVGTSKQDTLKTLEYLYLHHGFSKLNTQEQNIIIEEFLPGFEVSVFAAVSMQNIVLFCPMQDYKRLNDYDQGPNTGGMGAVGPLGNTIDERRLFLDHIKEKVFLPVLHTLKSLNTPFCGLLYAGLMLTEEGPQVLEFNVRFGDPETQALLFGTKADIFPLLKALAQNQPIESDYWQKELLNMDPAIAIVAASSGYPFADSKQALLSYPGQLPNKSAIFFAKTALNQDGMLLADNGRILNVVARGHTIEDARALGYKLLSQINFFGMQYRSDIGTNITQLGFNNRGV